MAQTLTVKPEYVNKAQVFLDGKTTLLNNNLTQQQLLAIYLKPEFRAFIDITYTNVADSFPEDFEIDPNLFHAYDSGELTHNPAGVYPANTVGKHLNDTKAKIDGFDNAFVRPSTAPSLNLNFAGSKFWNPKIPFSRNSIGTYIDQNGVMKTAAANKPRFTHDPVTKESLGLLMEETRTNLITYSGDLAHSSFVKSQCSVTTSTEQAPDSTIAQKIVESSTESANHSFQKPSINVVVGKTYTLSLFLKAQERFKCNISLIGGSLYGGATPSVIVDLLTGQFIAQSNIISAKMEYFGNGWYRISITQIVTTSGSSGFILNPILGNQVVYTGDGVSGFLAFGFQFEEGLNATSYIPTTAAALQRNTDRISIIGTLFSELFPNVSEGTLLINAKKADARLPGNFRKYMSLFSNATNSIDFNDYVSSEQIYNEIKVENTLAFARTNIPVAFGSFFYSVLAWAKNNVQSFVNSIPGIQDNDASIPVCSQFEIGGEINTIIKSIAFWPRRMTDAGLLALSSPTGITGKNPAQLPANGDLLRGAFVSPEAILRTTGRQELSLDGTGASVTRNIRRPYDFTFEVVDNSGVTSMTATPATNCVANTDNPLTFTAPVGKTLTYAITPVYEY